MPYFLAFVCLGFAGASYGPALPHLARSTGSTLQAVSYLFVAHRLGFVLGALGGGRLYDRVAGHRVLGLALVAMAVALVILPATRALWVLLAVVFGAGFMSGGVDVGGNVLLVWRVRKGLGPFMSFLHFAFGVGTFLGPLFLAQSVAFSGGVQWGYVALAVLTVPVGVMVFLGPSPRALRQEETGAAPNGVLVGLTALFLLLYVAAEVGFGHWIYTYAIERGLADEVSAGYLTSAYWGAYTLGRLLSVVLAAKIRPQILLSACLALAVAMVAVLWLLPTGNLALWICTMLLGLALAPMFPVIVTFASERTTITGRVTGVFLVGASVGGMSLPWIIGQVFGSLGPTVVPAMVFFDLFLAAGAFSLLVALFGSARSKRFP